MGSTPANPDLQTHLAGILPSETHASLRSQLIPALLQAIHEISRSLRRTAGVSQVGSANAFGDEQLNVDVLAERILRDALAGCVTVRAASSEEDPVERIVRPAEGSVDSTEETYAVAFDPLDGSSIIAPNWTVGTIVGIWEGETALCRRPEKQVAAILGVYGPRTTAIVAVKVPGSEGCCFEVSIDAGFTDDGTAIFKVVRPSIRLAAPPFKTRYFAPANLRSAAENPKYMALINDFIAKSYTLRYAGGLVPDIVHALVKGHGVYVSPTTEKNKAKLRRLYELVPIALVLECAGGLAVDASTGRRVLDTEVRDTNEKGGWVCGNQEEVEYVVGMLLGS